jgi:hypothetical protein
MKHGEPAQGYNTEQKAMYRAAVWRSFATYVPDPATATVLFLPGREALEVPIALHLGFREENLIACEENAALIATAKWRKEYPKVRCYATELQRTIGRLRSDGVVLDAANLDFCSNLSQTIFGGLDALFGSGVAAPSCVLAVTALKGREDSTLINSMRAFMGNTGPADRIGVLRLYLANKLRQVTLGITKDEYRSGAQNMVWAAWVVRPESWLIDQYAQWFREHSEPLHEIARLHNEVISHATPNTWGYSINKVHKAFGEAGLIGKQLEDEYQSFRQSVQSWCARDGICDDASGFRWFCDLMGWLHTRDDLLNDAIGRFAETKQQLMRSEAEKAQILQSGLAYR